MLTEIDRTETTPTELGSPADDIEVHRAPDHEASIVAAAKAWARARQAMQRRKNPGEDGETAELALYDAWPMPTRSGAPSLRSTRRYWRPA